MKQTLCDICGSSTSVRSLELPVLLKHDGCDGLTQFNPPIVAMRKLDICESCLLQSTNIYDDTIMGYGNIYIDKNVKK